MGFIGAMAAAVVLVNFLDDIFVTQKDAMTKEDAKELKQEMNGLETELRTFKASLDDLTVEFKIYKGTHND